jgi:hypothetical protein
MGGAMVVLPRKMWSSVAGISVLWAVGAVLLGWPHFSTPWRRRLAFASALAGLAALVVALNSEGSRASPTVVVFLMGTHYVTATAQASASLPFYLLSGVFLLLGFAGLALGDEIASALSRHFVLGATGLSLAITAVRFGLEKVAAPPFLTQLVGITWFAPVVGAFAYWNARAEERSFPSMLRSFALYAFAVRGAVFLLMLLATTHHLGSHYDVASLTLVENPITGQTHEFTSGSLAQLVSLAVLPQLVVWPIYTVAAGFIGAGLALALESSWQGSNPTGGSEASTQAPGAQAPLSVRGRP